MERTKVQHQCGRGVTLLEIIVCNIIVALLIGILLPSAGRSCGGSRQLKDASQVRGILQAMVLYAQNNDDRYPLPSIADIDNNTVPELGSAKDTSANIYSLLLWNGLVTTELLLSPVEAGNIDKYDGYELSSPRTAVNPAKALWDPAFRADFAGIEPGGVSYAHMLPGGKRLAGWGNTFDANQVAVANRGPNVSSVTYKRDGSIDKIDSNEASVTQQLHGRVRWSGNIGYNDNHVKFEQNMTGDTVTYVNTNGREQSDVIFFDEPDDPTATNVFLSIFTTAGGTNADFTPIWD